MYPAIKTLTLQFTTFRTLYIFISLIDLNVEMLTCFLQVFPVIYCTENNLLYTTIFSLLRLALYDMSILTNTSLL